MDVKISKGRAKGVICALPSKSMLHRSLLMGAMAKGRVVLKCPMGVRIGEDIKKTIDALQNFKKRCIIKKNKIIIAPDKNQCANIYRCGSSATTLRLLMPLALIFSGSACFNCSDELMQRGAEGYDSFFLKSGISITKDKNNIYLKGRLKPGRYCVDTKKSSQYLSGMLLALPLLPASSYIASKGNVSVPYIDLTLKVLRSFGIKITEKEDGYFIPGGQKYKKGRYLIEPDFSNLSCFASFNHLNGNVKIKGIRSKTMMPDMNYNDLFAKLDEINPVLDIKNSIDLGPILLVLAATKHGCILKGYENLKEKESNRIEALKEELFKFGVVLAEKDKELHVDNANLHAPFLPLCGHKDHRIVMALAVLLTKFGGIIKDAEYVDKSYPDFFVDLAKVGIEAEKI